MIERISGRLIKKTPTFCVIDCSGIGIGVTISINAFQKMTQEGSHIQMLTYLYVREDVLQLYGFFDEDERQMFRELIAVSGIGPRLAITILSGITVSELVQAISLEDHRVLVKIPGVGKKTAQRMVLELKEKVDKQGKSLPSLEKGLAVPGEEDILNEAILALVSLGYKQAEAKIAIEKVAKRSSEALSLEEMIKYGLKEV